MRTVADRDSLILPLTAIVVFALSYRYYGAFMANRVARVDPRRPDAAGTKADGATSSTPLSSSGTAAAIWRRALVGPCWRPRSDTPGALWILIGAALGGAKIFILCFASVRHGARRSGCRAARWTSG
jgi:carbon starvation protein